MRIVSLLPSATEILFALGLGDCVVGITHECDYPPEATKLPVLTRCVFDSHRMSPQEIDDAVRNLAAEGKSLYQIDDRMFKEANPDLVITQDLCHVCAITPDEVGRAVSFLQSKPKVISLSPRILDDVWNDMLLVADSAGIDGKGIVQQYQSRVKKIAPACTFSQKPEVGCLEWIDPLWRTGHWVPGMVELAGGKEVLAEIGKPSRPLAWEELEEKNPEILIVLPCGYNLGQARESFLAASGKYPWERLRANQKNSVYIVDANAYFSRSGPRLVDGLELLAEILHPEYFNNLAPVNSYIRLSHEPPSRQDRQGWT